MKAERRHELQENTLAHILSNFPLYASVYGGRVLLVATFVLLAIVLIRYRGQAKVQQMETVRASLATARETTANLGRLAGMMQSPAAAAQARAEALQNVNAQLDLALSNAESDTIRAEAAIAKGDFYWTLANQPDLPGAATQPALALPDTREALLNQAKSAYESVLASYPRETMSRATALLGLAAIAENNRKFDEAKSYYEQVSQSQMPDVFKRLATQRLEMLPVISKPRRLVPATAPAAATPPATGTPFLPDALVEPTTRPSTQPIGL